MTAPAGRVQALSTEAVWKRSGLMLRRACLE